MLAFCTNTVQWSALHSNPAIMTAGFVCVCARVCVFLLQKEQKRQEKEKQDETWLPRKNKVKPESSEDSVMGCAAQTKKMFFHNN